MRNDRIYRRDTNVVFIPQGLVRRVGPEIASLVTKIRDHWFDHLNQRTLDAEGYVPISEDEFRFDLCLTKSRLTWVKRQAIRAGYISIKQYNESKETYYTPRIPEAQ